MGCFCRCQPKRKTNCMGHNKLYIVCVRPCFPSILSSAQVNDCVAIYGLHFANRTIYYLSVGHDQYWTFHVILNWSMLQMIMPWLAPLHQTHWPRSETWLSFLDTWRITVRKIGLMGKQVSKIMCFPHRDETFGILAHDSAKQSICSNWMVLDGMMFVTTNQWISQNFHQARLRLKAAGLELESDANQALTKIFLVRRQVG